jgi:hypothetical protein
MSRPDSAALSLEVRRAAWDALWKVLLQPVTEDAADADDSDANDATAEDASGAREVRSKTPNTAGTSQGA